MDDFRVCGFEIGELLGFGATGEVWCARELATGETVALKRLRPGAGPDALASLRREAGLLRSLATPYVVPLREVVGEGAETVLVLDHAAGGSLVSLLRRRGSLTPGEVVTIVAPLAQALAVAHDRGIVHGDVSPSNVLFTADGMPMLSDLGVARLVGDDRETETTAEYADPRLSGSAPDAASDVWALGALAHHLLCGSPPHEGDSIADVLAAAADVARAPLGLLAPMAPRPLVSAIEQALSADLGVRPSAGDFGVALQRAQTAEPVRLGGADRPAGRHASPAPPLPPRAATSDRSPLAPPEPPQGAERDLRQTHRVARPAAPAAPDPPVQTRRLLPSVWVLASVGVVVVLLAAGLAWAFFGNARSEVTALAPVAVDVPDPAPSAPPRPPLDPRWAPVLDGLDRAREAAYAAADPARLADVYAPGFPVQEIDTRRVTELDAAGVTAVGVRHDLHAVNVRDADEGRVALAVTDVLEPHRLVDADGTTVQDRAGRGERDFVVVLVQEPAGWRIAAVTPA